MFDVPTTLSPSRVDSFTKCPMAFRFASIERLPEPPSPHTTKGSLVHRALELLFTHLPAERTPARARTCYEEAVDEYRRHPDFVLLGLGPGEEAEFLSDAAALVESYLRMEDPSTVRDIGLELRLEASAGELSLRGIIDRLELDDDGELIVTDYKTGRSPSAHYEQNSLAGVQFYSFLCEQVLGRRPRAIRLMYLRSGETITAVPSARSVRFITTRATAVWRAVERACRDGSFQPRPSALCATCAFQAWCPAFGGDPSRAAVEAPLRLAQPSAA
jgi:putative RecB family exonuclease